MSREKKYNRHHLIAKNVGGTNHQNNIMKKEVNAHNDWHYLFGTDGPASQILEVFKWNEKCWSDEFADALFKLLDEYQGKYYKKECHSGDKVYKRDTGNLYTYITK